METIGNFFREKMKAGFLVAVLVLAGVMSGVTAVLISYPALAFFAAKVG